MKKVFLAIYLITVALSVSAQSDPYLTLENLGGGNIRITNKQTCEVNIKIDAPGATELIPSTNGNTVNTLKIPSGVSTFKIVNMPQVVKIRALTICNWMGQEPTTLILGVSSNLPVKIRNIKAILVKSINY
jgi:hypothetical protein